jgi:hypothetical protein
VLDKLFKVEIRKREVICRTESTLMMQRFSSKRWIS